MNKSGIIIMILIMIFLFSINSQATGYKIYTNTNEIYYEIFSPDNKIKNNEIIIDIFSNNNEKNIKEKIYFEVSDLLDQKGNIIPAKEVNINFLKKQSTLETHKNKVIINNLDGKISCSIEFDSSVSYFPPGEYRGNLIIGKGLYYIPILLKINPFAQLYINKENINFNLRKPAQDISNEEEIEIDVNTNLENWEVKFEVPQGIIHEDGVCSFPLENLLFRQINDLQSEKNITENSLENVQIFSVDKFNNNKGKYNLKLNIWADIRDNWNCALAGEYKGKIYLTFINKN